MSAISFHSVSQAIFRFGNRLSDLKIVLSQLLVVCCLQDLTDFVL
jgi:hypothetical protein